MTKRFSVVLAAIAVVFAIAAPLSAQSITLTANVPFDFAVGNKTLPAGEYSLLSTSSSGVIQIASTAMKTGVLALTNPTGGGDRSQAGAPRLVFNRYGDQYFLSQIWDGYSGTGRGLSKARRERELAKTASAKRIEMVAMLMPR